MVLLSAYVIYDLILRLNILPHKKRYTTVTTTNNSRKSKIVLSNHQMSAKMKCESTCQNWHELEQQHRNIVNRSKGN